jgi:hypothetical protein
VPKGDGKQRRPIGIPTFEDKVNYTRILLLDLAGDALADRSWERITDVKISIYLATSVNGMISNKRNTKALNENTVQLHSPVHARRRDSRRRLRCRDDEGSTGTRRHKSRGQEPDRQGAD